MRATAHLDDDHGRRAAHGAELARAFRRTFDASAHVRRGQRPVHRLHAGARLVHALAVDDGEEAVLAGAAQPVAGLVGAVAVVHHVALWQPKHCKVRLMAANCSDPSLVRSSSQS